jgi:hypothetical protein
MRVRLERQVNEMKNALWVVLGAVLMASHLFAQSSTPSEVNRIVGARLSVEYKDVRASAAFHVTNVSSKIISTVRISYRYDNDSVSRSISARSDLKPGETSTQMAGAAGAAITNVSLDAIVYADGVMETRNDAVIAEIKEDELQAKEQHEKEMEYARAFAIPNPASHMPEEEQIVRNYYAKLGLLAQFGPLSNLIMHGSPKLTEAAVRDLIKDQIHVNLSEFQTGDFAEIATQPWTLLLTPDAPQGVIDVNSMGGDIGVNQHKFSISSYQAVWSKSQSQPQRQQERRDQIANEIRAANAATVKDVVRLTHPGDWSRFASFTVSARLRGQAISYRATFLFADQGRKIAIFDPAMRMPVALNGPFYPTVLVESVYRELPFFKRWVAENQLTGCKRLKEPEVCCDPETGRCGLASEDVAHSLTFPIDENDRWVLKGLVQPDPAAQKSDDAPCPVLPDGDVKK